MQITSAVSGFNYPLVAYAAAQLAAQLGDQSLPATPPTRAHPSIAEGRIPGAILSGPIYQAFEGQPRCGTAGCSTATAPRPRNQVQQILEPIKPVVQAALELVRAPTGQIKARRKDLVDRVAALGISWPRTSPAAATWFPMTTDSSEAGRAARRTPPAAAPPGAAKVAAGARGGK